MAKGYIGFAEGLFSTPPKPRGQMKYIDWRMVQRIVEEHPDSVIYAGLREDWGYTSGLIYAKGKYYDGYVFGQSNWATPIVDVDGEEIECYVTEKPLGFTENIPSWWGGNQELLHWFDYEDEEEV